MFLAGSFGAERKNALLYREGNNMYYLDLYWEFIKIRIKTMAEYRAETLITGTSQIIGYFARFVVLWIMVSKFQQMGQWNAYEIMLIYSMNLLGYSLANVFIYRTCHNLVDLIHTGDFDGIITKPTNPFMYLCCSGFMYGYWAHITLCVGMMIFCFNKLGITFTIVKVLFLILSIIGSALIQGAVQLASYVPTFWIIKSNAIQSISHYAEDFAEYPISIYNKLIQVILTFVIPYAFISFYPLQYLLGKDDFLMFHPVVQYLTPAVGLFMAFLAYRFWLLGLKHYNSSGS